MRLITPLFTGPRTGRTVIFFPHAGGSPRFFTHLAVAKPQHQVFGVTYPGRDHLVDATPVTDIARLSALVADELMAQYSIDDTPLILVGHSLGAFVAYRRRAERPCRFATNDRRRLRAEPTTSAPSRTFNDAGKRNR